MISTALIFAAFALIHSITVSGVFKRACRRLFGDTLMRVFYRAFSNIVSVVTAAAVFLVINHLPDRTLWTAPSWLQWPLQAVRAAGLLFGALAFRHLNFGEFLGCEQVRRYFARRDVGGNVEGITASEPVTAGVYGIVRHPMYLAGIILFTLTPHVTVNGITLTVLADAYFLFGMFAEERRFLEEFGDRYREYMVRVPRLIPRVRQRRG